MVWRLVILFWLLSAVPAQAKMQQGINAGGLRTFPSTERAAQLTLLRTAGIQLVRSDANGDQDEWVAALATHGLRWAPMLGYNPAGGFTAPDPDEFASYARAQVARYGHDGSFWTENPELPYLPVKRWEVWNEQNAEIFWVDPDPVLYASLFNTTKHAIKAEDPRARVMSGGLLRDDNDYLKAMLAAGARPDIIGLHPYFSRRSDIRTAITRTRRVTRLPIALTEVGWTDTPPSWYPKLLRALPDWQLGVTEVMPYAWVDPYWGLATEDGPTERGEAYLEAVDNL